MQKHFQKIKSHFQKSDWIFITKDYDYPSLFCQEFYLSFLEFDELIKNSLHEEILRRITTNNNEVMRATIMGMVAYLIYNCAQYKTDSDKVSKATNLDKYLNQVKMEGWKIVDGLMENLLLSPQGFSSLKPQYKSGMIVLFAVVQKYSICQSNNLVTYIKTLPIHDQTKASVEFSIELISEFQKIIDPSMNISSEGQKYLPLESPEKKMQGSLLSNYLFGKLIYLIEVLQRIRIASGGSYNQNKDQWSQHLHNLMNLCRNVVVKLSQKDRSNCLAFGVEFFKYIDKTSDTWKDPKFKTIYESIVECCETPLKELIIQQHLALLPYFQSAVLPLQISHILNSLDTTLLFTGNHSENKGSKESHFEKSNVLSILDWNLQSCKKEIMELDSYGIRKVPNFFYDYIFSDIVRWSVSNAASSLEIRSYVIQWALYNSKRNESISRKAKQAFFYDWIAYLRIADRVKATDVIRTLEQSLAILEFLSIYVPNAAEDLLTFILGKKPISSSESDSRFPPEIRNRQYLALIFKLANELGLFKVQTVVMSRLSNFIKSQVSALIGLGGYQDADSIAAESHIQNQSHGFGNEAQEYYGNVTEKKLSFGKDKSDDEDQILYSSHEFIRSESSEADNKEKPENIQTFERPQQTGTISEHQSSKFKRHSAVQIGDLQTQVRQDSPHFADRKINSSSSDRKEVNSNLTNIYLLKLQKQYLEEMEGPLKSLMKNCTLAEYEEFEKGLLKQLKFYKKSSEEQMMDKFIKETAKVLYLCFSREFESLLQGVEPENSLVLFLIRSVHNNWRQSVALFNISVEKKIIRELITNFRMAEMSFWLGFLQVFRKGVPFYRQMRNWMFDKSRDAQVVPLITRLLDGKFKVSIYENAQCLGLVE